MHGAERLLQQRRSAGRELAVVLLERGPIAVGTVEVAAGLDERLHPADAAQMGNGPQSVPVELVRARGVVDRLVYVRDMGRERGMLRGGVVQEVL